MLEHGHLSERGVYTYIDRKLARTHCVHGLSSKQLGHPPGAHELCSKQDRQMVWVTGFTNQCLMTQKISVSWQRLRQCWLDIDAGHHQLIPQLQAHRYIVQCNVTHASAVETKLYLFLYVQYAISTCDTVLTTNMYSIQLIVFKYILYVVKMPLN